MDACPQTDNLGNVPAWTHGAGPDPPSHEVILVCLLLCAAAPRLASDSDQEIPLVVQDAYLCLGCQAKHGKTRCLQLLCCFQYPEEPRRLVCVLLQPHEIEETASALQTNIKLAVSRTCFMTAGMADRRGCDWCPSGLSRRLQRHEALKPDKTRSCMSEEAQSHRAAAHSVAAG